MNPTQALALLRLIADLYAVVNAPIEEDTPERATKVDQ